MTALFRTPSKIVDMESDLRDDIRQTNTLIDMMLTEPEENKEDLDLLIERKTRLLRILGTSPWAKDMHRVLVAAGFFLFRTPSKIEQYPSTIECGWCSYIENWAIKPA
jgi:hypothetical protein